MLPTFSDRLSPSYWLSGMTASLRSEVHDEFRKINRAFNEFSVAQETDHLSLFTLENRVLTQKKRIPPCYYNSGNLKRWKLLGERIEKKANGILVKKYQEQDLQLRAEPQSKLRALKAMLASAHSPKEIFQVLIAMKKEGFKEEARNALSRLKKCDAPAHFFFHVGMWAETRLWHHEARAFYFRASDRDKDYLLPKHTFGIFFAKEASKKLQKPLGAGISHSELESCLVYASKCIHEAIKYDPKNTYYLLIKKEIHYLITTLNNPEKAHSEKSRKAHRDTLKTYAETGTLDRGLLSVDSSSGLFGRDIRFPEGQIDAIG